MHRTMCALAAAFVALSLTGCGAIVHAAGGPAQNSTARHTDVSDTGVSESTDADPAVADSAEPDSTEAKPTASDRAESDPQELDPAESDPDEATPADPTSIPPASPTAAPDSGTTAVTITTAWELDGERGLALQSPDGNIQCEIVDHEDAARCGIVTFRDYSPLGEDPHISPYWLIDFNAAGGTPTAADEAMRFEYAGITPQTLKEGESTVIGNYGFAMTSEGMTVWNVKTNRGATINGSEVTFR